MEVRLALERRGRVHAFQRKHHTGVVTLLFTDIAGSTQLKQDLGDVQAMKLLSQHQEAVRDLLSRFAEAEEIGTAGDSFFLVFVRPSDAVRFSLLLQTRLRELARETRHSIFDRVGIHVGEVVIEEREDLGKDVYGIQVDVCSRISGLAQPAQVLMSRFAFDNARQVLKGQGLEGIGPLSWLNHGPYRFKGIEETLEICEVGEIGLAPLAPPADSDKARRSVAADGEFVLGWRPALGLTVPNTQWTLEQKLGEGGFGEAWLACHATLKERRVFKFCFRADRVRSLKREVTLFRLLNERVGRHPHIVGVQEVNLETPPFYIVMDYAEGTDLTAWCKRHGGVASIPLPRRLEIVAQVADALQAAHAAGIIHRDVKPLNILVSDPPEVQPPAGQAAPVARLTDFGIGQVVSQEALQGLTRLGFTQTVGLTGSSQTGTLLYMAPELLAGKPASTRSDIYSLGVVLYQLTTGDFGQPVTTDWSLQVSDPFLKEDLAKCLAGNPQDRFASAGDLAQRLRTLPQRHLAQERRETETAERRKARLRHGAYVISVGVILLLCLLRWLGAGSLEQWERSTFDLRVREAARFHQPVATNLGFVEISDESALSVLGGSGGFHFLPFWPRQVYGRLVQELTLQGAKAIALDIMFAELRPYDPPVQMADGSHRESDQFFADQMQHAGNVILAATTNTAPPALFFDSAMALGDVVTEPSETLRRAKAFRMYRRWHSAFAKAEADPDYGVHLDKAIIEPRRIILPRSKKLGDITIPLDEQGNFDLADFFGDKLPPGTARKAKPFSDERVWHMGVVLGAQELKLDLSKADVDLKHGRITLRGPGGVERILPIDAEGFFYIDWCMLPEDPRLTAAPIQVLLDQNYRRLKGETNDLPKAWAGKLVVVGSTAAGLRYLIDLGATPLGEHTALASEHWNVANSIITGRFVHRAPFALDLVLITLLGIVAAVLTWRLHALLAFGMVILVAVAYAVLAVVLYVHSRYWLPLVSPVLGILAISVGVTAWRLFLKRGAFSRGRLAPGEGHVE